VSDAPVTEQEAHLSVTVVRTTSEPGKNSDEGTMTKKKYEDDIALSQELRTAEGPRGRVTMSRSVSVSDAAQWGPGTFDKINYKVEVFASVSLECDQTNSAVRRAQNIAYALAWEAGRKHLQHAVVSHDDDIRKVLYAGYFPETKA
jgi:hypothetical protein